MSRHVRHVRHVELLQMSTRRTSLGLYCSEDTNWDLERLALRDLVPAGGAGQGGQGEGLGVAEGGGHTVGRQPVQQGPLLSLLFRLSILNQRTVQLFLSGLIVDATETSIC